VQFLILAKEKKKNGTLNNLFLLMKKNLASSINIAEWRRSRVLGIAFLVERSSLQKEKEKKSKPVE
jgi:hypothetical protein